MRPDSRFVVRVYVHACSSLSTPDLTVNCKGRLPTSFDMLNRTHSCSLTTLAPPILPTGPRPSSSYCFLTHCMGYHTFVISSKTIFVFPTRFFYLILLESTLQSDANCCKSRTLDPKIDCFELIPCGFRLAVYVFLSVYDNTM